MDATNTGITSSLSETTAAITTTAVTTVVATAPTTSVNYLLSANRLCSNNNDSGIENCSISGNSSVLFNNVTVKSVQDFSGDSHDDGDENGCDVKNETDLVVMSPGKKVYSDSRSEFEMIEMSDDDCNDDINNVGDDKTSIICSSGTIREVKIPKNLDLSKRLSSQSSTEKICEVDLVEERDTFSPLNTTINSEDFVINSHDNCAISSSGVDNKIFSKKKIKPTSTKEEKQRQNEEIVIMETSSLSSETGSWESVFPHRNIVNEVKDSCRLFLTNERENCIQCAVDPINKEFPSTSSHTSSVTACFIDASTLLDEPEVSYSNVIEPRLPLEGCFGPKPSRKFKLADENSSASEDSEKDVWPRKKHLDKLESFHKSFEMCKTKNIPEQKMIASDENSSASNDSPQKVSNSSLSSGEENTNNLSDEEKIWKRENSRKPAVNRVDVKDQYNKKSPGICPEIFPVALSSSSSEEKDQNFSREGTFEIEDKEIARKRRDQERKQGNLVFQNSIQQFSGHLISPRIPYPSQNSFVDYSASPSSIIWSESGSNSKKSNHDINNSSLSTTDEIEVCVNVSGESRGRQTQMFCVLPDTPNNSIVQIETNLKRNLNETSHNGDSDSSNGIKIPKRRCDVESAPIVSGGASIKDFTPKQCESPPVQRKTETCPIVSGGIASFDFKSDDKDKKIKEKIKSSQPMSSWVVDMSDCKNRRRRSTSSSSSAENTARSIDMSFDRNNSASSQKGGLGFYVSLNDIEPPKSIDSEIDLGNKFSRSLNDNAKKSTGFYVDLSENESSRNATPPPTANIQTPPTIIASNTADKKNIFSMFIDFGDKKAVPKREPLSLASRLSNSLHQRRDSDPMKISSSSTETLLSSINKQHQSDSEKLDSAGETRVGSSDESKKPSLPSLVNENEAPLVIIRRTTERNSYLEESKRHSWNNPEANSSKQNIIRTEHKRSSSLSGDRGIMNILDKISLISKTSSLSIDSPLSPFDDITCSKSEISTYSNNSITSASLHSNENENLKIISKNNKKRRKDVQLNETFDKSSQGSITDGVFSKTSSSSESTTDTEDLTFQQDENYPTSESTCIVKETGRAIIMETIIETKETSSPKKLAFEGSRKEDSSSPSTHTMETLQATMEKQKQLLETVIEHSESNSNFVKLSDMDKPVSKFELHSPESVMSKSVGNHRNINKLFQETKATRPYSWVMTRSTGNNIANITSSVENLRSISRLFPHFTKEFSNSLPSDVSQDIVYNRSPVENDFIHSDVSTESSLASSFSRSGMDESSLSCRQPRRLGEDLLKMFLQEIATDVIVEVNGRRIKAHKCILRSRCQYFAAMLAGGWVQSAGNVISLPGYSYSVVHFALCHIYSGASHPPEGISLMELAALADLLGLEGLKEVTAHALKLNYCHNFHKPCSGCTEGILQVLPVALNHTLDDLYRKCLKWTCKHYLKVWPTRPFAQLPSDILGRCRQQVVAHLTSESVLEIIMECDNLISQLAPCRWALTIENLVRDILDAAYNYASDHFASIIASDCFLSLGHDKSNNISLLESSLLRMASSLNPDQGCRSYQRVTRLNAVLAAKIIKMPKISSEHEDRFEENTYEEEMEWNEEFIRLVSAILSAVEQCLIRQCARAMRVTSWQRMDLELRKKIQKLACLTEPLDLRRTGKPISKQISFGTSSRTQDLHQVKLAIQAHSKKALAQDSQLYRATTHTQTHTNNRNIQTIEKGVQANNEIKEHINKVTRSTSKTNASSQSVQLAKNKTEKTKIIGHRRTQSEDSSSSMKTYEVIGNSVRVNEIRPRYLEPRKPRGIPLKSATSSNIPSMKGRHISSSDSSRTSSPATNKRINSCPTRKIGPKSINMSLDSLTSPSKRSDQIKKRIDNEISVDSLAESMKSSVRTNKTISQESLTNHKYGRSNQFTNNKENKVSIQKPIPQNKYVKNKSISCQNTSGSSPSSITNKSSRLSSTTSSVNSPRDAFKNRSISSNSSGQQQVVRKSFFTPKSREILARKSANSLAKQSLDIIENGNVNKKFDSSEKLISSSTTTNVTKCASSSNIPTRKAIPPTTLHLRKTMKVYLNSISSPTKSSQMKTVSKITNNTNSNNFINKIIGGGGGKNDKTINKKSSIHEMNKKLSVVPSKIEVVVKNDKNDEQRFESKLERSSTFCKESSDLPVSDLQMIE